MTNHVSAIAAIPEVREKLVSLQQEIAQQGGIVMDGRDIGTVVLPQAELKIPSSFCLMKEQSAVTRKILPRELKQTLKP